jgi:hypothetical protein
MNRFAIIIWIGVVVATLVARRAMAYPPPTTQTGDNLRVFVLTFGPGDDPWEKWGHNAIEIQEIDALRGKRIRVVGEPDPDAVFAYHHDRMYNWGVFDFGNLFRFSCRFVQGKLIYQVASDPSGPMLEYYVDTLKRSVYRQELNLSGEQKLALRDELLRLDTDANRHYLYNYYSINCSSKVRDAVDKAVGGKFAEATKGKPTGKTYRFHTDRLDAETIWLYVALQAVLGHPVDQPIDQWQEMFLPMSLHDRLGEMKVQVNGYEVPLVKEEGHFLSKRPPDLREPPMMAPWFLGFGVALGAIFAVLAKFARRHWAARWGFIFVSTPWMLLMGLGGPFLWWVWLATDHEVGRYNENVMQVSVLALPLLVMIPRVARGKLFGKTWALRLTWAMAGISVVGLLLKALPWFYQVNYSIIAMCLPVNLALAYAVSVMGKSPVVKPPVEKSRPEALNRI